MTYRRAMNAVNESMIRTVGALYERPFFLEREFWRSKTSTSPDVFTVMAAAIPGRWLSAT